MNYLGSKEIETNRLILKPQTMQEQKVLWEILMIPEVNKYFLTIPKKFGEKMKDWNIQKNYYEGQMKHANDSDIFKWSIFLKENNECIGRISCHERHDEDENITSDSIRGVGWYLHPRYQGKGYTTEAALAMVEYMFNEVGIDEIRTGAAIVNPASWKVMEKLGFIRQPEIKEVQYTFVPEPVTIYLYSINKEQWKERN